MKIEQRTKIHTSENLAATVAQFHVEKIREKERGGGGLCRPRLLSEAGQAWSFPLEKPLENEENRGFRWESEPREDRSEGGRGDSGEQVSVRARRGTLLVNAW